MAKKNKRSEPVLQSWDDVDKYLREIGECEIAVSDIENELNATHNELLDNAKKITAPMISNIERLKAAVEEFVTLQKSEMDGKSRLLNFGKVGFRQSSSVSVPAKKLDEIIENLKKYGMNDCVLPGKETVDKERLIRYSEKEIVKAGAALKVKDNFFLETDKVKIKG